MAELTIKIPQLTRRRLLIGGAGLTASLILAATAIFYLNRATGLTAIVGPVTGFTPYFFHDNQPPNGYTIDKSHSLFSDHILQITLSKPGQPPLVLTEQTLPGQLTAGSVLNHGNQIKGAAGPATVNTIDQHVVGTMLPNGHATLILITGPEIAKTDDVASILKALVLE